MDLGIGGRRAVVTGGSRGIGLATARVLTAEGCDVALVARTRAPLEAAGAELAEASGRRVVAVPADTGDDASVAAMAAEVAERLGPPDILINAAATPAVVPFAEEDLEREVNVKVRGYLRCIRAFAPHMAEAGWGRIVNVAGLAARRTGNVTGSIRNLAVVALTKNLADELGPSGVTVNVVHPGTTRTETLADQLARRATHTGTTPEAVEAALASEVALGRLMTAEEVAWVIAFLASDRGVAVNGDLVVASGGIRGPLFA